MLTKSRNFKVNSIYSCPRIEGISLFKAFALPPPKQRFGTPKQKIGFSQPGPNHCFGGGKANAFNEEMPSILGRTVYRHNCSNI